LASFDTALDCASANNRLKRRRVKSSRGGFGFAPEFALNISIEDHFLDANGTAIRVRKTFCHRAGEKACGNRESDERDIRDKI